MTSNSSSSELNISEHRVGFSYYQEQLKAIWTEVKRSAVYEHDIQILQAGNDVNEPKSKMCRKARWT
jgi:hypothetical protein